MDTISLRSALRANTSHIHQRLDDAIGSFGNPEGYRTYLRGTYRFRRAIEPALACWDEWEAQPVATLVARDLADLGAEPPSALAPLPQPASRAAFLGATYVLEGSAVGARLMLRRAAALGYGEDFAARHLARQSGDTSRWPRFLTLLDQAPAADRDQALAAAAAVFDLACSAYLED